MTRSKTCFFSTALLFLSFVGPVSAQVEDGRTYTRPETSASKLASHSIFRQKQASVHYSGTALRESLQRFAELQGVGIFLDRRIDPSRKIYFEKSVCPLDQLLEELGESLELDCFFFDHIVYIGPKDTVDKLPLLLDRHRKQIRTLPEPVRLKFMAERSLQIPFLTEPRQLIVRLLEERGLRLQNPNRLPHDLWDENTLPAMPFHEQLILLLVGFEIDYSLEVSGPNRTTLTFTEIPEFPRQEALTSVRERGDVRSNPESKQSAPPSVPLAQRRFSLKIEQQRLNIVLEMLAERIGLSLRWDEPSLESKGVSKESRISFDVKNVTAHELLRTALKPLGLEFRIENQTLLVR